jgi:hypothetical protein
MGKFVLFVPTKEGTVFEPEAANPVLVLLFVHAKEVPATLLNTVVALFVFPAHNT